MAAKESLFQILLRQPWWVTLVVALLVFAVTRLIYPPVAPFTALPFVVLCGIIAFRQFRGAAPLDAHERLEKLRAMDWDEFSALVVEAYRKLGYTVHPATSRDYDFRLTRNARVTLLQCRRWKVNQVGVGPLRELLKAVGREDASHGICIAAGDFSAPARALTATEPLTLVDGAELVTLVGALKTKPGSDPKKTGV
ncbi:MAG TPA: restriction endonuclease [Burkholderiales bacterium]|nr:restriction endonuclease [Burkholderiales bacterium]